MAQSATASAPGGASTTAGASAPTGTTGAAAPRSHMDPDRLRRWLTKIQERDPRLHAELVNKLPKRGGPVVEGALTPATEAIMLETIVRAGRPALLIQD